MDYFETSAKENINIQELMMFIMDKVYENLYSQKTNDTENNPDRPSLKLGENPKPAGGGGAGECKCMK